ncbi:MAG: hypothetical protein HYX80_04180 [Chloroflexi bacterium]|nr:hypothetical protein [Chloroflexota bacterium]
MSTAVIPLISAIVSLIFAVTVLDQFFARRKPYQLVWAIGLLMYAISTGAEFWAEANGISLAAYRLWYLFGAILVAAYLGMGTIYLLTPRRLAHVIMAVLLAVSIYAAARVYTTPIDLSSLEHLSGRVLPESVRALSRYLSYTATLVLVGGAIYSSWVFMRKKILPHRVSSNLLIALGVLLPAIGGGIMRAIGNLQLFYVFELLGIIIIFLGFLRSREVFGFYRVPLIHGFKKIAAD